MQIEQVVSFKAKLYNFFFFYEGRLRSIELLIDILLLMEFDLSGCVLTSLRVKHSTNFSLNLEWPETMQQRSTKIATKAIITMSKVWLWFWVGLGHDLNAEFWNFYNLLSQQWLLQILIS